MMRLKPLAVVSIAIWVVACAITSTPTASPTATTGPTTMAATPTTAIVVTNPPSAPTVTSVTQAPTVVVKPTKDPTQFYPSDVALLANTGRPQLIEFFAYW